MPAGRSYIVTAAAQGMAEVLARVMTFDGALGSALGEVEQGVYTGRPTGAFLYGAAKAVAIQQLAAREGFDLSACYAYSDSVSDAPMLRAVGHPVVVNPDADLEQLAATRAGRCCGSTGSGRSSRSPGSSPSPLRASAATAA